MTERHASSQFEMELNQISSMVLEMGGMVEQQMRQAVEAMVEYDPAVAQEVCKNESRVNVMEMQIDRQLISVIGRRQPTARDLRQLMAVSRITANLERAGDEVERMARMVQSIIQSGTARPLPSGELRSAAALATDMLRKALNAFARRDAGLALEIIRTDDFIDTEYNAFMRQMLTYMMEDPRTITSSLSYLFIAKSIERIGDHAKNLAESVIYAVNGLDVRHTDIQAIESHIESVAHERQHTKPDAEFPVKSQTETPSEDEA